MVIRNDVGDPLIMELTTGDVSWLMPRDAPVSCIKYFTHVTPQGKIYYENLVSNVVQWELPGSEEISDDARFVFESVLQMSREEVEQALSKTFDEQAVNRQMTEIDLHFYGQQADSEIDIAPVVVEKSSRRRNSVMDAPPPPSVQTSSSSPSASTSSAPSNGYNKNSPITPMQKMFDPIDNSNIRTISDIFSSTSSSTSSSSSSSEDDRPQVLATVPPPVPALPVTPLRTKTTMHDDSMASHPPQPVKSSPHADNSSMDKDTGVSDDDVMERPSMSFNSRRVSARKPPLPPPREDSIVTQPQSYPVAASQRYPSAVDPSSQSFPTTAAIAIAPFTTTAGEVASQSTSKLSASSEAVAATSISLSSTYQQPAAVVRKTAADIDKKFKVTVTATVSSPSRACAVAYHLLIIYRLTSIVYHISSIIYHLSIVYRLTSIIYYLLSIIHRLTSIAIIYCVLSIIYHHLSYIVYHLLSIIHRLSSIVYHLSFVIYHLSSIIYHLSLNCSVAI